MSIERGPSPQEIGIVEPEGQENQDRRVEDINEAREKPPTERLIASVDKIAAEMREKGLGQDAAIVQKIKDRFDRYSKYIRNNEESLRKDWEEIDAGTRESFFSRFSSALPVTHRLGKDGGALYKSNGRLEFFSEADKIERFKNSFDKTLPLEDSEVINFSLSEQGETQFYRALGVLGEGEEVSDIPTIYDEAQKKEYRARGDNYIHPVDPKNYNADLPTNIEGLRVNIRKGPDAMLNLDDTEEITLRFDRKFMETILDEK